MNQQLAPEFLPEKHICIACRWAVEQCHCAEYDELEKDEEPTMNHETIAHVTVYLDKRPAYVDTLTGAHLLKQASDILAGDVNYSIRGESMGFHGTHAPRFIRLYGQLGTEAHVTFLRFPKAA